MPKTAANLEDYEVLATIGTGSFGTCKKIQRKSDRKVLINYVCGRLLLVICKQLTTGVCLERD